MSWGGHMGGWGVMEEGWRKGPWTSEEDRLLIDYVRLHGEGRWNSVARLAGLKRNGKSCRLRWVNYLRPDLKRGQITPHEESIILELHARWGNRWSTIARSLPGRTDNEIKNYWRTHFKKKAKASTDSSEKAKSRLLRRQQFQQQMQQQHQMQQQQQQFDDDDDEVDMKKLMSLMEESENSSTNYRTFSMPQLAVTMQYHHHQPNNTTTISGDQQQSYSLYSMNMMNTNNVMVSMPQEGLNEEVMMWDSLWSMDDVHAINANNFSSAAARAGASAGLHNLVTPFC